jgi:LemA protein
MEIYLIIGGVLLIVLFFWYVSIISKKNKVLEALSGVDVQLKKRHNLIPNILKIAKKFMEHEEKLLTEITELRTEVQKNNLKNDEQIKDRLKKEAELQGKLSDFFVSVENYPDLKSDQTMIQAQRTYNEVEEQISASRRFYNSAVNSLNTSIQIFPGSLIAKLIKVKEKPFFEVSEEVRQNIDANSFL